jgi:AraC-like DNA-binding protein
MIKDGYKNKENSARLLSFTQGKGELCHDGIAESFEAGDTFWFDNSKEFSILHGENAEAFLLCFNFSDFIDPEYKIFDQSIFRQFLCRLENNCEKLSGLHINAQKIQEAMYLIEKEFQSEKLATNYVIKAYIILILSLSVQYLFEDLNNSGTARNQHYKSIKKSLVYIKENLSDKLTLDELSHVANMGKTNYSLAFKAVTGMTVCEYIQHARVELAANYLLEKRNDFNITEIALMSGFNTLTHFTKTFKKIKGNTPSEFKNDSGNPCF